MPPIVGGSEGDDDDDDDDLVGETEDLPSPSISDVEDVFLGSGFDADAPTDLEGEHDDDLDDDNDNSSPSDADNLLDFAESSVDLIAYDGTDSAAEEWTGLGGGVDVTDNKRKRSRGGKDGAPARRKKHRSLPTFASYEDYARMIEDGPEENL